MKTTTTKNFKKITFICSVPEYSMNYDFLIPLDDFNRVGYDSVITKIMKVGNFDHITKVGFSITHKIVDKSYKRVPKSFSEQKDLGF